MGVVCLSIMAAAVGVITQHQDLAATLSDLSLELLSPPSPQASLVHSALLCQGSTCLWLSPSVVDLVTLHSAVRLKHHRAVAESLLWLELLFPLRLLPLGGE